MRHYAYILWRIARVAAIVLVPYACLCLAMCVVQGSIIYPHQSAGLPGPPPDDVVVLERSFDGGKTYAWLMPPKRKPAPLIVFCHGNAELIDNNAGLMGRLYGMGFAVLMPEYRGYGNATGEASQTGITDDAAWFLEQALKRPDIDASRVVYFGRSLGGGVAVDLARRRKPNVIILQSTFTSAAAMAHRVFMPGFLVAHPYRNDKGLRELDVPVLIVHGTHDDIIPVSHGRSLAAEAKHATLIEFDCGHNDFPGADADRFWTAVDVFLRDSGIVAVDD